MNPISRTQNLVTKPTSSRVKYFLLAAFCVGQLFASAATFTVTPPTVSNTYVGRISLDIAGLTNTETVVIQKYLDANTNNLIDGSDWLVQQFRVTDGAASTFYDADLDVTVTNINVPYDLNAVTGAITAPLNFKNGDFVQNLAGKYLFKLSSPGSHFTPITNLFTVTNVPFGQRITGNVVSFGTNVPFATVIIFLPATGDKGPGRPVGGVVANNSGNYTMQLPVGSYLPVAFKSNYVSDFALAQLVNLGSGATVTTNLALTNATATISGRLVDAATNTIGVPGVFAHAMDSSGKLAIGFTDTNGYFTFRVRSGTWQLEADSGALAVPGYMGYDQGTNVTAPASNLVLPLTRATAIIYGNVKDNLNNPMADVGIYGEENQAYIFSSDGVSDVNGNYVLGVRGGGLSWWTTVDDWSMPPNYVFSEGNMFWPTNGQAQRQDFRGISATNHITGHVQFNGSPVGGVRVRGDANIGGTEYASTADADDNGDFSLLVAPGDWSVNLETYGDSGLDNLLGAGNYQMPANQGVSVPPNGTANFTILPCSGVQISTTSPLPDAEVNSLYDFQFFASGCGGGPILWSINDPQNAPPDLSLMQYGEYVGTPLSAGTYNFTVHASDNSGHSADKAVTLTINPQAGPLQISTLTLPVATNGEFYSQTFAATGGTPPYTWTIPNYSADPPAGLSLATNGVLSGTPSATQGWNYFDVQVTDSAAANVAQTFGIYVNPALTSPLIVTNVTLAAGTVGVSYNAQLGAVGGHPPYTWDLALGSAPLPAGLSLSSGGLISGTPTTNKVSTFKVQIYDLDFNFTNKILSITINPKPMLRSPVWTTNRLEMQLVGASNQNYTIQMSTNLISTNWTSLLSTNSPTANTFMVADPSATNRQRYYRVKLGL